MSLVCSCGCGGALHGTAAARFSMTVRPVGGPPVEPLTLAEAKVFLRIDPGHVIEDGLIQSLITAAREAVEQYTERTWAPRMLEARYTNVLVPTLALPVPAGPVRTVTTVEGVAPDGVITALTGWRFDAATVLVWPGPEGWPAPPVSVAVTYDAGPITTCPEPVRLAMYELLGQSYEHRAGIHVGSGSVTLPFGVDWLLGPYRATTGVVWV
jgi:uncharacterized phiE125 gp8 family phage protein